MGWMEKPRHRRKYSNEKLMRLALASSSLFAFGRLCPAGAATFNGLEYTLTGQYTDASHSTATFNLSITGINGANDTEGGRYGLNAFAFSLPQGFSTASAPGFTLEVGGRNSSGCNGAGNFFCFNANAPKPSTTLAANSSLEFEFSVALLAGYNFDNYDSHFKVDWLGSLNNYNLISQQLSISVASSTRRSAPCLCRRPLCCSRLVWLVSARCRGVSVGSSSS